MSARPCHIDGCDGTERPIREDYGSLGSGGSYEEYQCDTCGNFCRSALPD